MNLKETYNKIAEDWHKDHGADTWWQGMADVFASYLKKGDRVLDVGCAGGVKSQYLVQKGLRVTGIDFSEKFIEIAKREVPEAEFLVMDINDIDKLREHFDGIFMQAVLLHIPKKAVGGILAKAVQKLNPGGYLYVGVKETVEGEMDEGVQKDNDYGYEFERFFSFFTSVEVEQWFSEVGLEIVYEDVKPPSRKSRNSNWVQLIGKKK